MFNPNDGHIDPYSLTQAIAIGARKHGAKLLQKTEVTKLDLKENGTWDIQTSQGVLNAGLVINAAGFWGKEVPSHNFHNLCGFYSLFGARPKAEHQLITEKA